MGKSKGKHRLDKFYHLAKEQGYRSRAAFKLVQLNRKYDFLSSSRVLLDLCAAPGGWLQVAAKTMPVGSLIVGVDLDPIRSIPGVTSIVGDITSQKTRQELKKMTGGAPVDTVLHDGAPNVGGAWTSEAYSQSSLVLDALRLATETLGPKGTFVTKIFRSQDYNSLLYAFKQLFDRVDATKPVASRNTSAEIFVVCRGYKAPARIDPRLLDSKHLFQEVVEAPKKMGPDALLKDKFKASRHRGGYEEGLSTTHRTAPATAFLLSDCPVEMLGHFTSFALEGPESEAVPPETEAEEDVVGSTGYVALAARIRDSRATTAEIRSACADLQVLGRSEFKALLKWRMQVKRELKGPAEQKQEAAAAEEPMDEDAKEEALLEEMQKAKEAAESRTKKERKKRREARLKSRIRAAQMAEGDGINQEAGVEGDTLFSLSSVKGRGAASALADAAVPEAAEMDAMEADEAAARQLVVPEAPGSSASDSEDDRRYLEMTEEALEDAYSQYLNRQGVREAAARRRARLAAKPKRGDPDAPGSDDEEEPSDEEPPRFDAGNATDSEEEGDGLLVKLDDAAPVGRATSDSAIAAQWFSQDVFATAPTLEAPSQPAAKSYAGVPPAKKAKHAQQQQQQQQSSQQPAAQTAAAAQAAAVAPAAEKKKLRKVQDSFAAAAATHSRVALAAEKADGFETVPRRAAAASDSSSGDDSDGEGGARQRPNKALPAGAASGGGSDSSDDDEFDFDSLDLNAKAEVRALAKRMLRKRSRDELVEGAYNKYAFHDDNLPRWFWEDQQRHSKPPEILTKEEMEAARAEMRAVDARPIKKVLEAKARKRKRLSAQLDKARAKSEALAGQEDLPMRSKMKEIEKIYAKARAAAGQGGKKDKKGGGRRTAQSSKGRPLDRRMMSDKRERNSKAKRAAAKKAKKGKGGGAKGRGKR